MCTQQGLRKLLGELQTVELDTAEARIRLGMPQVSLTGLTHTQLMQVISTVEALLLNAQAAASMDMDLAPMGEFCQDNNNDGGGKKQAHFWSGESMIIGGYSKRPLSSSVAAVYSKDTRGEVRRPQTAHAALGRGDGGQKAVEKLWGHNRISQSNQSYLGDSTRKPTSSFASIDHLTCHKRDFLPTGSSQGCHSRGIGGDNARLVELVLDDSTITAGLGLRSSPVKPPASQERIAPETQMLPKTDTKDGSSNAIARETSTGLLGGTSLMAPDDNFIIYAAPIVNTAPTEKTRTVAKATEFATPVTLAPSGRPSSALPAPHPVSDSLTSRRLGTLRPTSATDAGQGGAIRSSVAGLLHHAAGCEEFIRAQCLGPRLATLAARAEERAVALQSDSQRTAWTAGSLAMHFKNGPFSCQK